MWGDNTSDPLLSSMFQLAYWNGTVEGYDCAFGADANGALLIVDLNCDVTEHSMNYLGDEVTFSLSAFCVGEVKSPSPLITAVDTFCL